MKKQMMLAICLAAASAFADFEREDPAKYWNLEELSQVPEYRVSPYLILESATGK